jgi:hypothetical protein
MHVVVQSGSFIIILPTIYSKSRSVAAGSEVWTALAYSKTWSRGFDSHSRYGCRFEFMLCVGSGLSTCWFPVQGALPNWRAAKVQQRAVEPYVDWDCQGKQTHPWIRTSILLILKMKTLFFQLKNNGSQSNIFETLGCSEAWNKIRMLLTLQKQASVLIVWHRTHFHALHTRLAINLSNLFCTPAPLSH